MQERKTAFDPYSLDPSNSTKGPDGPDSFRPGWSALLKRSTMPFIMAPVNARLALIFPSYFNPSPGAEPYFPAGSFGGATLSWVMPMVNHSWELHHALPLPY